jgi:hypothetical protein
MILKRFTTFAADCPLDRPVVLVHRQLPHLAVLRHLELHPIAQPPHLEKLLPVGPTREY